MNNRKRMGKDKDGVIFPVAPKLSEMSDSYLNFIEEIKIQNIDVSNTVNNLNKEIEREKFLDEIDGNREALNKLTIEQLKRLDKYYDAIIEENKSKIKKAQM